MSKKENIRHLWKESFRDSDEYLDMYFDRIYRDADASTIEFEGKTVSSLLAQPYKILFHGRELPITYFAGAVTRRSARGRGYMTALITDAIAAAAARGDLLCALIPAHDWLYFFFDRFGFSTVFLCDTQRFTSLHTFAAPAAEPTAAYHVVDDIYSEATYDAFARMERQRDGSILHSRRDYLNLLDDYALRSDGSFICVGRDDTPVAAMIWAYGCGEIIQINELLAVDNDARLAAMRELRRKFPDRPMRYLAPSDAPGHRHLYSRGMARIVNARLCLSSVAAANPEWNCTIRIHDPLIESNNRTFRCVDGRCEEMDQNTGTAPLKLDFDIDITVLNKIVFSAPATGRLLNFPALRGHISLMPH